MRRFLDDLRISARALARSPGFTATAVLALTLGIGLTTTTFSIAYGTLLRGLPFPRAEELVHFERASAERSSMAVALHDYVAWQAEQRSFTELAAFTDGLVDLAGDGSLPERTGVTYIEPAAFRLLTVDAAVGRVFTVEDDRPGAPLVALLGHGLWQRRFGADPEIIGRTMNINGRPTNVVGVMTPGFAFPLNDQLWLPLRIDLSRVERGAGRLDVFGMLRPGMTIEDARLDFERITGNLARAYPETNADIRAVLNPYIDEYVDERFANIVLAMLLGAVLVLLVGSLNVANLLLVRGTRRARELAVRVAIGAGRIDVASRLMAESVVLAVAGAVGGLVLARVGVAWFTSMSAQASFPLPHGSIVPFWWDVRIDMASFGFAAGVAGIATLVAGLAPALRAMRVDPNSALREETSGSSGQVGRLTRLFLIGEVAITAGVLATSGLMVKSVVQLADVHSGFRSERIVVGQVGLPDARTGASEEAFPDLASRRLFWSTLVERLEADPSIEGVAVGAALPLQSARRWGREFDVIGGEQPSEEERFSAGAIAISDAYFDVFDAPLLTGRRFDESDGPAAGLSVIVNQAFATRYLPGTSPVGRQISIGEVGTEQLATVVGLVGDLSMGGVRDRDPEAMYLPMSQGGSVNRDGIFDRRELRYMSVALLVRSDARAALEALRTEVDRLAPNLPVYGEGTMEERVAQTTGQYRLYGTFYIVFGAAALFLAVVGIFAVTSYVVSMRTREVGIRMALGADRRSVLALVLRGASADVGGGLLLGALLAMWIPKVLTLVLYRVETSDPWVFGTVFVTLATTCLAAVVLPARRAARVDPLIAIRYD